MKNEALDMHKKWQGKIEVALRCPLENKEDRSLAYTPGVAEPCLAIRDDPALSFSLTRRGNTVAVITDGTAVLGLGDIGPEAGMPVMEGKCALFKRFGGVDAIPLCVRTKDPDEFVRVVSLLAGSFGGINLEDIAAPRCFEIERRLSEICDIPVFHDDQHGTAIVAGAALLGALKVVGKEIGRIRCVINGAGSAGIAIGQHLLRLGVRDLVLCDRDGVLAPGLPSLTDAQAQMLPRLNPRCIKGTLTDAMTGADVLIGVSRGGVVSGEMVRSMNNDAVVFALANPVPEIAREDALAAGARVVGCGRSDTPNQINNLLAFPGVFRGALDCRARTVNDEMKCAATYAIAACAEKHGLSEDYVIPSPFDESVCPAVAAAVIYAARRTGAARL
ncbi:MAG: NADP-dependent malic enzyme [Clostridia bacterium]|nr:NADP-dependent malic enzyme [Clostridia bacterium]